MVYIYKCIYTQYTTYIWYTVRGVYNHKLAHIDRRERSWCVMVCRDRSTDVRFCVRRTTLFGPFLLIFIDFHHSTATSIFSHSNFSNFKMLLLIEFLSNKNSNQYDRQQISAQTKHIAQIFNFCN